MGLMAQSLGPTQPSKTWRFAPAYAELRAAVLARQNTERELTSLYHERNIARARATERNPAQPLQHRWPHAIGRASTPDVRRAPSATRNKGRARKEAGR